MEYKTVKSLIITCSNLKPINRVSATNIENPLNENEKSLIRQLRYYSLSAFEKNNEDTIKLSDSEIKMLLSKMDDYMDYEGAMRRAFGSFDETYILELFSLKNILENM